MNQSSSLRRAVARIDSQVCTAHQVCGLIGPPLTKTAYLRREPRRVVAVEPALPGICDGASRRRQTSTKRDLPASVRGPPADEGARVHIVRGRHLRRLHRDGERLRLPSAVPRRPPHGERPRPVRCPARPGNRVCGRRLALGRTQDGLFVAVRNSPISLVFSVCKTVAVVEPWYSSLRGLGALAFHAGEGFSAPVRGVDPSLGTASGRPPHRRRRLRSVGRRKPQAIGVSR